jgi:DUF4097 and DUF4098 domain-containing protein YvlB
MSTTPPFTPPGGAPPPIPPFDAKNQYRAYREQQKAAWRAQREAWKAQRYAAKVNCVGVYGPRVPSVVGPIILIGVGVVALLLMTGRLDAGHFWSWYGHWWPMLLIGAGLLLLGEWTIDLRRKTPVRRGGGFVGLLILLAFLGFGAAGWSDWWGPFSSHFGDQDDDFFNTFRQPEHDFDQKLLNAQIPSNAAIDIENPRGDVSVTAGDGSVIEVQAREVAYANSDADAQKIFDSEAAHLTVSGNAVLVKSESNSGGRLNLTITVPKNAHVSINSGKGDVTAAGLGAGINVAAHGEVHLSAIAGSVQARFSDGNHDFSAHDVQGDLSVEGDLNDVTFSEIKGKITQNGGIVGDVHIENVSGDIHLHTTVTDLEVAGLPGDLTLSSDELRVSESRGPVHVVTHSKDVELSQISGDSYVEDKDGRISIEPAGNYGVDAKNSKGDVEVTLPPNASATVNAQTHNGDILTDFGLPINGQENKSVSARIGSGSSRIVLSADNGDVHIKKGSASQPAAPLAPANKAAAPKAPKLKANKALPAQPVSQ